MRLGQWSGDEDGAADRSAVGAARWLGWHLGSVPVRWLFSVLFRPHVTGLDALPTGGWLLLANHTSSLDTLWVALPTGRIVHFMTSAAMFRNPLAGALLRWFNCFEKAVGEADPKAVETVRELLGAGQVVQIMPEGTRTWDGRLQPIRRSIGELAVTCGVPVVLCRVDTGHLVWPRWATWPRWVPLHMHYELCPVSDSESTHAAICAGLTPRAVVSNLGRCFGLRTAEGLESYLWACPVCGALRTWSSGSMFGCGACERRWNVTVEQRLIGATSCTIAEAWDAIVARFGARPVLAAERVHRGAGAVRDRATGHVLARGLIDVDETGMSSGDWSLPFSSIQRVTMDAGNILLLRTRTGLLQLQPAEQSTWMWYSVVAPRCGS